MLSKLFPTGTRKAIVFTAFLLTAFLLEKPSFSQTVNQQVETSVENSKLKDNSEILSTIEFHSTLTLINTSMNAVAKLSSSISNLPPQGGNIKVLVDDRVSWKGTLEVNRTGVGLYFLPLNPAREPTIHASGISQAMIRVRHDNVTIYGGNWQVDSNVKRAIFLAQNTTGLLIQNAKFSNTQAGTNNYEIGNLYTSGIRLEQTKDTTITGNIFDKLFFDVYAKQVDDLNISHNIAKNHTDASRAEKRIGGGFLRMEVGANSSKPNSNIHIHRNLVFGYQDNSYGGHLINLQLGKQTTQLAQNYLHQNVKITDNIFDVRVNGQTRPSEVLPDANKKMVQVRNGASGDVVAIKAVNGFEISGNAIYGSGEYAITVIASKGSGSQYSSIRNNTIVNSDGAAIVIGREPLPSESFFPKSQHINVSENIVSGSAQMLSKSHKGILKLKNSKNWSKANAWGALRIRGSENVRVKNNLFTDIPTYGVWLRSSDKDIIIENNAFEFRKQNLKTYTKNAEYDYGATWENGVQIQFDNKNVLNNQTLSTLKVEELLNANPSVIPEKAIESFLE